VFAGATVVRTIYLTSICKIRLTSISAGAMVAFVMAVLGWPN
jgi:hypothetical protein